MPFANNLMQDSRPNPPIRTIVVPRSMMAIRRHVVYNQNNVICHQWNDRLNRNFSYDLYYSFDLNLVLMVMVMVVTAAEAVAVEANRPIQAHLFCPICFVRTCLH